MSALQVFAKPPTHQDNSFKRVDKKIYNIWPAIPFFQLGDIAQYEKTMSQDRDRVRKMFWGELTGALEKLADKGVAVEVMLEPMANILMMFDQAHDIHKAKDALNIDKTLEAQFRASLDHLFSTYDVRDGQRKIQISAGTNPSLLQAYVREISVKTPLGNSLSSEEINVKVALEMFEQIDYVSYGTFSNLGSGRFQLTYHLTGNKNGVSRSFIAVGPLTDALDDLTKQVFDFFQKNLYPDWENPQQQLQWLSMPVNPKKLRYTWEEASHYCKARGYRLPYARELQLAESGGPYKEGGIASLDFKVSYAVADRRMTTDRYVYTPGNEAATGGPVQGASYSMDNGKFWCVKGPVAEEVQTYETVWSLIRQYNGDREIYRALESVRYEIGDFGSDSPIFWGPSLEHLERMGSLDESLRFLNSRQIHIKIPSFYR